MDRPLIYAVPLAAVLLSFASLSYTADKTWTGAAGNRLMSDGGNWQEGVAPSPGDQLFFLASGNQYVQNDIAGASFGILYFSTADDSVYTVYGNPLTLTGSSSGYSTISAFGLSVYFIDLDVSFATPNASIATTGIGRFNDSRPAIQFVPGTHLTFSGGTTNVSVEAGSIDFAADIAETAQTSFEMVSGTKLNVTMRGNNTFTGSVTAFVGFLNVESANALGTPSFATFMAGNSVLQLFNVDTTEMVIPERFALLSNYNPDPEFWGSVNGGGMGPVRLTGDIVLDRDQVFNAMNHPFTIDGVISGIGHLEVGHVFNDVVVLTNSNNSFSGGASVTNGTLRAGGNFALGLRRDLTVAAGATLDIGATLQAPTTFECAGTMAAVVPSGVLNYDQSIALTNCALAVSVQPGYIPMSQEVMTVVRNQTNGAFGGQFANYPEGTTINVNGVSARASYVAGVTGNDFAFVAETLPAGNVTVVSGGLQSVALGTVAATPFVAKGFDRFGRPAAGTRITFTATGCGSFGGSAAATVSADAQGVATAPAFTASNTTQICFVTAAGDAPGTTASFEIHEYAPANVTMTAIPASLSTVTNRPFSVAVELRGLNGMSLPGLTVTFQAMPRGQAGVASLDASAVTNAASSRATANGLANGKSGNYDIVARFGSLSRTIPVSQKAQ